jgi:hypothetical protein
MDPRFRRDDKFIFVFFTVVLVHHIMFLMGHEKARAVRRGLLVFVKKSLFLTPLPPSLLAELRRTGRGFRVAGSRRSAPARQ